ncbi:hypothetical protein [Desulfurella sp.]|jgi:excinuclease UvrABC helicase subunit UvrB|uniref:hypothetical protein n=2 Tax=Desulfurella sp. TaxID=1962857 RepID=UPI003D12EBD2
MIIKLLDLRLLKLILVDKNERRKEVFMQVNASAQVQIDTLKKAIDQNKQQVSDLIAMQQKTNNTQKINNQSNQENLVPKSKTIGNQFDQMA